MRTCAKVNELVAVVKQRVELFPGHAGNDDQRGVAHLAGFVGLGRTRAYSFCWGMGGENQDYADMDPAPVDSLR